MHGYRYESASKSWPSKFLSSNSDLITMGVRPTNSYGTHFVVGEFSVHNRSGSTVTAGVVNVNVTSAPSTAPFTDSVPAGTVTV